LPGVEVELQELHRLWSQKGVVLVVFALSNPRFDADVNGDHAGLEITLDVPISQPHQRSLPESRESQHGQLSYRARHNSDQQRKDTDRFRHLGDQKGRAVIRIKNKEELQPVWISEIIDKVLIGSVTLETLGLRVNPLTGKIEETPLLLY